MCAAKIVFHAHFMQFYFEEFQAKGWRDAAMRELCDFVEIERSIFGIIRNCGGGKNWKLSGDDFSRARSFRSDTLWYNDTSYTEDRDDTIFITKVLFQFFQVFGTFSAFKALQAFSSTIFVFCCASWENVW